MVQKEGLMNQGDLPWAGAAADATKQIACMTVLA